MHTYMTPQVPSHDSSKLKEKFLNKLYFRQICVKFIVFNHSVYARPEA